MKYFVKWQFAAEDKIREWMNVPDTNFDVAVMDNIRGKDLLSCSDKQHKHISLM